MSQPYIISIGGGTGSGKSTIAHQLLNTLRPHYSVSMLSLDAYYHDLAVMPKEVQGNYDHPLSVDSALFIQHVRALKQHQTIALPQYDFTTHQRQSTCIDLAPTDVIILDGILLYACEGLFDWVDTSVYVDVPADIRLARRILRDTVSRGRTVEGIIEQYLTTVRPMHDTFVAPFMQQVDLQVSGIDTTVSAVDSMVNHLKHIAPERFMALSTPTP